MANQIVKLKKGSDYLYPYASVCGVDTTNVLATINDGWKTFSYTATEDCVVVANIRGSVGIANIDSVYILGVEDIQPHIITFYILKGQTFNVPNGNLRSCKIFGIKR